MSGLLKRSLALSGHRTSVALESEFWERLDALAEERGLSVAALVASIDRTRPAEHSLASSLRLAVLLALTDRLAALTPEPDGG